jgi:hypothetical protein
LRSRGVRVCRRAHGGGAHAQDPQQACGRSPA